MNSWTKQTGYPLISLTKEKSYLKIDQERFFSSRISKKENEDRNLWQVPIIYDEINNNNNNNKNEYKILLDRKSTIISKNSLGKINKNVKL